MNMERRRLMTGLGTASIAAVAGCLSSATPATDSDPDENDDDDNESEPILTGYTVSEQTVRPAVEHASEMDAWGVFVGSRSTAVDYFTNGDSSDEEALQTFIEETDFEAGDRLLYVEGYAPQTCYELIITDEPTIATNGLPAVGLGVNRTAPDDQPCGDAVTAVDSLIRLSFDEENGAPADVIEVTVDSYKDDPETLLIDRQGGDTVPSTGTDTRAEIELVDPDVKIDDPPEVSVDNNTVIVRGSVQYASSSCGTVKLAHAEYEDSQDRLDLLVVAGDDTEHDGECTDDIDATGYRIEATVDGRLRRIATTEHHHFGQTYSTTTELTDD